MVFIQIRTSFIVLSSAIYFSCLANCHVFTPLHKGKHLPVNDLLILPTTRTGFSFLNFPSEPITVLQEEGYIDTIQTFAFVLPPHISLSDIRFEQASSDDNVLNITGNNSAAGANMVIEASDRGPINITTTLVFDSMVGFVRYTLAASDRRNNETIDLISVWYRVVGMTCYLEQPSGELEIVSGEANEFVVSFEQVMNGAFTWHTFIKVFIQYADGSTSRGQVASELSSSDTLKLTSKGIRGQITHDDDYCDIGRIGSKSISGKPQLPLGCGYGFYYGPGNELAFGFIFHSYRIGSFALHFSWMGINNGNPVLQSEYLELSLRVRITGTPPLVIVGIDPISMLLRKEGGEMRTIKMINVNLHDAIAFEVRVSRASKPFKMIPRSYISGKSPDYVDQVSVLTEPGSGVSLNWTLFFQTRNASATKSPYKQAKFHPSFVHLFSYDIEDLHIRSLEPRFANEDSDTIITIHGHFPYFSQDVDSINFSGTKLPQSYLIYVSRWVIRFILPKRYIFGSSYDFRITVRIGFAESNHILFSYLVRDGPTVSVRFYGVSLIAPDTYRLADCSFAMFTIALFPFSNLVQGFTWTLYADSNATSNLLDTEPALKDVDSFGQTIRLDSDILPYGSYILKCDIQLLITNFVLNVEIFLVRKHSLALGVSILPVGNQSLAEMGSTFRLTAVVNKPSCLTANGQLFFEWDGFGQKSLYSPLLNETNNSVAIREGDLNGIRPSRLGLEFSISREKITTGSHKVTFRAWVNGNESVFGEATDTIHVHHGPLVAVIRSGEKRIDVNYLTTLTLYGNLSYDSSLHDERRFENLSYQWECLQSKTEAFLVADSVPCDDILKPKDVSVAEFMVSMNELKSMPEIRFVRYNLTVRKDDRTSSSDSILVEIVDSGSLPHFDEYSIELTDADGNPMTWSKTEFYKEVFISVNTASNSSWSFDLIRPLTPDFLTHHSIIDHPAYYSPSFTIDSDAGSSNPLGIRANVLRPSTAYIIQITIFNGSPAIESEGSISNTTSVSSSANVYGETHILIVLQTVESVVVHMSTPKPIAASSKNYFAIYGGVSTSNSYFFYQFLLTDQSGNDYCCGGCTGMDTTYFYFSREGDYILSVLLTDEHGNIVTRTTASETIQLRDEIPLFNVTTQYHSSVALNEYRTRLEDDFMFGNDRQWLQTAHDASIMVVKQHLELYRSLTKTETSEDIVQNVEGLAIERQLSQEMDIVLTIAENLTAVFCNSYPNTHFGKDGIVLLQRLSKMNLLGVESFYFLIEGASCCIKKTPSDAIVDVVSLMSTFISNLNRLARTWSKNANTRRRLLQIVGQPANAIADLNIWTGDIMAYTAASGTIDGFSYDYDIGYDGVTGHITLISASEASHLLESEVNGISRRIVGGPSDDELFYPRDSCILKLFEANGLRRRVFAFITVDNFVLLGFQDPPIRSNLVDKLYWIQIFERGPTGLLQAMSFRNKAYCYCWKLPVIRLQEELENAVDDMPGLYGFYDMKNFRRDAKSKGEVYNYDYRISKTSDYNTSEGWVEGCQIDVGLVSTTVVSKSASNILDGGLTILGFSAWAIVGLVVGGVVLIMVAVVSAWLVTVQAVSESPTISSETIDVYVERDIYGRGTGLGNSTMH